VLNLADVELITAACDGVLMVVARTAYAARCLAKCRTPNRYKEAARYGLQRRGRVSSQLSVRCHQREMSSRMRFFRVSGVHLKNRSTVQINMFPNLKLQIFRRGSHQNQLAKAVGIDETVLSKIIHGYRDPTATQRELLAAYLDVDEVWLF